MKYVLKNLTRRPVSILCNSGKSYHLPPKFAYEISAAEIENNVFILKLQARKVIDIQEAMKTKTAAPVKGKVDVANAGKKSTPVKDSK